MKLLDTNILIYSGEQEFTNILQPYVTDTRSLVSVISQVETLGYMKITPQQAIYFESLFLILEPVPVDDRIIQKAIELRQSKKLSLGDSLIAASAIVRGAELITRNTADF
ncbi:MAG: type II toxin-antitoxin system VapC family toxin [Saprospiraceae bacterium]|nr:type II toxin-antitoxin system VapC family toxin [Saprospiraceae bacterium]MDZ4703746.1 type II toxin-antitoxin system VapC family toxin [Saprospiraceae bacterium]